MADSGDVADRQDRLRRSGERLCGPLPPATPLQQLAGLPLPGSGASVWVKRDDLRGPGGTKTRKLVVAFEDLRRVGASGLLTFGTLDSNHALASAELARAGGLRVELFIETDRRVSLPGRRRAFEAVADRVTYGGSGAALVARAILRAAGSRLTGHRMVLLPPGGTNTRTTAGVAIAVLEVVDQFRMLGIPLPERWAVAVGTGGTLAGLLAGIKMLGLSSRPVGFLTSSRMVTPGLVAWLANRALRELGHQGSGVLSGDIEISDRELGAGHGSPTPASTKAIEEWGRAGVPLDSIYTAKAAAGLRRELEQAPDARWLFWHTGTAVAPIS